MQPECSKSKTLALVRILERIGEGEDLRLVAKEVGKIAGEIGSGEILAAQDRLRQSGYSDGVVAQLLAAFTLTGVYEQSRSRTIGEVVAPHILQTATAEHAMFRALAAELERVLEDIRALEHISDTSVEFRRLTHIVHHLKAMNEHFDREEDVILPYLRRQSWASPCRAVVADHAQLRAYIDQFTVLVAAVGELPPEEFQSHLAGAITGFCPCLREHLSFEDGLLWPLALVVLDDPATWKTITALCDEIGYCGIHVA
jgi:DUF438 domain-containing protein